MLRRTKGENHEVLFHHRFSTSTADVPNACHPFSTKDFFPNNYVGVHNGVLSNDHKLEEVHKALGITYVSKQKDGRFNDSEALIYDIARTLEGQQEEMTASGSIAFIVIKRNKQGKATTLFFGRNSGNPLKMKKTKHSLTLSSQGEGVDIEINQLYSYDYETGELTKRYFYIPYYRATSYSSGYQSSWNGYGSGYNGNNYCRPAWDREEDEDEVGGANYLNDYNPSDYEVGDYILANSRTIIKAGDWEPRTGTQSAIEADLLEEAGGDFMQAAIDALVESDEAGVEEKRINDAIYGSLSAEVYDDLCDYWYGVNAYKLMMSQISSKFETKALEIESNQTILLDSKLVTA